MATSPKTQAAQKQPFFGKGIHCYGSPDSFRAALLEMLACPAEAGMIVQRYRDVFSFEAGIARLRSILDSTICKG